MSSELKTDLQTPRRRTDGDDVRLTPVQPRSTLLTVLFFSAVALAIGYWIFFPPAAPTTPETTAAPAAQVPRPILPRANIQFTRISCAPQNFSEGRASARPILSW